MSPLPARKKYNLLYIVGPSTGGIKTHVTTLVMGMDKEKFNIYVMAYPNLIRELRGMKGVVCHEFNMDNLTNLPLLIGNMVKLYRFIYDNNIEIVHSHGFKASVMGCLMPKRSTKIIVTIHNFIDGKTSGVFHRFALNMGTRIIAKNVDLFIAVSKALARAVSSTGKTIAGSRIRVIYNGIDAASFRPVHHTDFYKKSFGYDKDNLLIGSVCRLVKGKGLDYLIESIALLKHRGIDVKLLIAGEGPYKGALIDRCKYLKLWNNVRFYGYINNITDFYNALDIFVLPTLAEGLGLSILEAMAAGKPVIATRVGGVPEIVTNLQNGILVRPGDAGAIADAIMYYVHNPRERVVHGMQGQNTVRNRFTCRSMVKQTRDIYLQVLGELV
ncbi:MAG TPA: glycosyltransferase family 4 protein [Clostridiales bacterium]|nr:glycosyltransferase family 4 protein [Clostridiales bacterium]